MEGWSATLAPVCDEPELGSGASCAPASTAARHNKIADRMSVIRVPPRALRLNSICSEIGYLLRPVHPFMLAERQP